LKFFRNYFLLIFSFISFGFVENEKINASPRESYKSASICRDISDAEFKEYSGNSRDSWINYYCIDKKTKSVIKKRFRDGKFVLTQLLGKLNQPEAELVYLRKNGWEIREYTIEGKGENRVLVEYSCWSDDSFECGHPASRSEQGFYNREFIPKNFESKKYIKSFLDMSMCERLSIKDEKLCKELDKLGY